MNRSELLTLATTITILAVTQCPMARADITSFNVFKDASYQQTSDAQPTSPIGYFFSSAVVYNTAGDVGSVSTTYSGPNSPLGYTSEPGNMFLYQTGFLSKSDLDTQYPFGGPYTFNISGGTLGSQSAVLNTPSTELYPSTPYLTGNSYSQLQGLNASQADTITVNGFTPPAGADASYVFITISQTSTNATVYSQTYLSPSTSSFTFAANTFAAGTTYNIDLDYTSRIDTQNAGFGNALGVVGFDQRTEISFTTASVPEPSSLALISIGLASACMLLRRRRSQIACRG